MLFNEVALGLAGDYVYMHGLIAFLHQILRLFPPLSLTHLGFSKRGFWLALQYISELLVHTRSKLRFIVTEDSSVQSI